MQLLYLTLKFHLSNLSRKETPFGIRSQNGEYPRIFRVTGANQNARKLLSTDLVNTNTWYPEFKYPSQSARISTVLNYMSILRKYIIYCAHLDKVTFSIRDIFMSSQSSKTKCSKASMRFLSDFTPNRPYIFCIETRTGLVNSNLSASKPSGI